MSDEEKVIFEELQTIARNNNIQCRAMIDISGGAGWINYKKIEENDYKIQLSVPGDFAKYSKIRDSISSVFLKVNAELYSETDYGNRPFGFQKELIYMDSFKKQQCDEKENKKMNGFTSIQTQINGNVSASGNINTGNAETIDNSVSKSEPDEKWFQKEIVKMILSFIGGVAATLVSQWIISLIK